MNIGIDIDDTISDTYEVQFNVAQYYTINTLKRDGKIKELTNLNTHFYNKYLHDWNDEEEMNFFTKHYKECLEKIIPKMYAVETIKKLKEEGNKIILITARFDWADVNAEETTLKWLKENNIEYDKLIVNAQDKAKIATENKIDVFLDDSFDNCVNVSKCNIKTYIMDSRVNRALNNDKVERVYSWPHFYQKIKEEN